MIWEKNFRDMSFPQFKYLLYTNSRNLNFEYVMYPVACISVEEIPNPPSDKNVWQAFRTIINRNVRSRKYTTREGITNLLRAECGISEYRAREICDILVASMSLYNDEKIRGNTPSIFANKRGEYFSFNAAVNIYFNWVQDTYSRMLEAKSEN